MLKIQNDISNMLQDMLTMQNMLQEVDIKQDVLKLQKDVSTLQREFSNIQHGLTFIYGRKNLAKTMGTDLN